MLKDSAGQTSADITTIFMAEEADRNATSAAFVAADDGTIYYTNDTGYLFAVGKAAADEEPADEVINPKTGDSSNMVVYLAIGFAMLAGLALVLRKMLVKA